MGLPHVGFWGFQAWCGRCVDYPKCASIQIMGPDHKYDNLKVFNIWVPLEIQDIDFSGLGNAFFFFFFFFFFRMVRLMRKKPCMTSSTTNLGNHAFVVSCWALGPSMLVRNCSSYCFSLIPVAVNPEVLTLHVGIKGSSGELGLHASSLD